MLVIESAKYHTRRKEVDVTEELKTRIVENKLVIIASNDIAGDPEYGKEKKLTILYTKDGVRREKSTKEGGTIILVGSSATPEILPQAPIVVPKPKAVVHQPARATWPVKILSKIDKPGMTDIIIPTYNNEELTVLCFESIRKHTAEGTYRIIWVDNGSTEYKKAKRALLGVNHTALMQKKNLGFVGAINKGLKVSDAPTVCLLNNDTEVSPGWLDKLTDALYADPKMGIVGPLTGPPARMKQYDSHHNIAYQQLSRKTPVFPYYKNLCEFNIRLEQQLPRTTGDIQFVAFLCGVMKREVIEKVTAFDKSYKDGLDVGFKMGMWDDCDYGWAIEQVGYKSAIALDTCIIHKGRSTFKIIQAKEGFDVDSLVAKNRKFMDKKHQRIGKELRQKGKK